MCADTDNTEIYFLGNTAEIIYNTDVGVYEIAVYRGHERRSLNRLLYFHIPLYYPSILYLNH